MRYLIKSLEYTRPLQSIFTLIFTTKYSIFLLISKSPKCKNCQNYLGMISPNRFLKQQYSLKNLMERMIQCG